MIPATACRNPLTTRRNASAICHVPQEDRQVALTIRRFPLAVCHVPLNAGRVQSQIRRIQNVVRRDPKEARRDSAQDREYARSALPRLGMLAATVSCRLGLPAARSRKLT